MLQSNFTVTPTSGDVHSTEFTFTQNVSGGSVSKYVWDFGNNKLIYDRSSFTHTFNYPGTYNISLSVTDFDGNESVSSQQIFVDLAYRDYIKFTQIPEEYANPGKKTNVPFKIEVLSSNPDKPILVDLFADNSNSAPHRYVPEKWNFLTPTWKFLDSNSNVVSTLSVDPVKIYKNNKVVAVSGTTEFYYVDSMSTGNPAQNCPLLLTATLQTSSFNFPDDSHIYPYYSYANNETVKAALVWQVNDVFPTRLKITGNYLDPINKLQWKGVKIPILITCHSNRSDLIPGSKDELSEVIFSYPQSDEQGQISEIFASEEIQLILVGGYLALEDLTGYLSQESEGKFLLELSDTYVTTVVNTLSGENQYTLDEAPLFFQPTDKNGYRAGGYIFTTATVLSTISNAELTIQSFALNSQPKTNDFIYPEGLSPNTSVWISNPREAALNKITLVPNNDNCSTINYFKNKKILVEGILKEIKVPKVEIPNTTNYALSGFSGIFSIAIDPRNYDVVATDAEADKIYKISNSGEILKTFSLSSLNDYDSRKKMFDFWTWKTPSQSLSSTNYTFYNPAFRSRNPKNYIGTLDGLILPSNHIQIPENQTVRISAPSGINTPLNQEAYPPEGLDFGVIQLFNPLLPSTYINSLTSWTYETSLPTNTFSVSSSLPTLSDSKRYIVSIDGFYKSPNSYNVSSNTKELTFTYTIPGSSVVNIHYFKESLTPAYWEFNLSSDTNFLPLTGNPDYVSDQHSGFIIAVDGKLIPPTNFAFNSEQRQITFSNTLLSGVSVSVTQITVDEDLNIPAAYTPSYVSLDKNYNIWVTLFDSVSVLKFDPDLNLLFTTVPSNINWEDRVWTTEPQNINYQSSLFGFTNRYINPEDLKIDLYTDEFFLKPTSVETDKENNCWVTYSNPLCSLLVKYDVTGAVLAEIPTGQYSSPVGLAVNSNNNVWVANSHSSSYDFTPLSGSLDLYDGETFSRIKSVKGISRPHHLSIDRQNNLWFSHGIRRIGYYDTKNDILSSWTLDLTGGFTFFDLPSGSLEYFDETDNEIDTDIGGVAVDVYDRVWILDSYQNEVWVISATPFFSEKEIRHFKARPDNPILGYYPDLKDTSIFTQTRDSNYDSIKATGDWTGNRWYQKYISYASLSSVLLSGVSDKFSVVEFEDTNRIKKVNESFNNSKYFKNLALPENLKNNDVLFDQFFAAAVGTGYLSANEDLGEKIYEKIANFTLNHSDIDACNVDQLLSMADQIGESYVDFAADYPSEIKRLLDIFSVPRSKLWGVKEQKALFPQSIGVQYNTFTTLITAGTNIVARNKIDNSIKVIQVPIQNNTIVYPLSTFLGYGLIQPITSNYLFYEYHPVYSGNYIENIIDWESEFTSLSPTLSTYQDWYGADGCIENAFRYLLTKYLTLK